VQIAWVDLGLIGYAEAFAVQTALHQRRCSEEGPNVILFQENFHVITLGRSASTEHLLASPQLLEKRGVTVCNVSRGGDITYHGPGQLVISPIFKLSDLVEGIHQYVRLLEQVVMNLLATYGINAGRVEGASGVWVGDKKIAALGIAIKNGVTQHGVAINVCPDLSYFDLIVPCGLEGKGVTSIQALGGAVPKLQQVRDRFLNEFSRVFAIPVQEMDLQSELGDDLRGGGSESCPRGEAHHPDVLVVPQGRQD
jgi:lipoate-protein ligase B